MSPDQTVLTDDNTEELKYQLLGSLLLFTQVFFKELTNNDFIIPHPIGRESHVITLSRELTSCFYGDTVNLGINISPGCWKSTFCKMFIAWGLAHYPDANAIYVSYSADLATSHTADIKKIIMLPLYKHLFGVELNKNKMADSYFQTTAGGVVVAAGSGGTITGYNAGLPLAEGAEYRYTGCFVWDDAHKPSEVWSDPMREEVITNYKSTFRFRRRNPRVPYIGIGQRLHEEDIFAQLYGTKENDFTGIDGNHWKKVILKSRDDHGNILNPSVWDKKTLDDLEKYQPEEYYAQHQQEPQPSGGAIFKKDRFNYEQEPIINSICSFITVDTAASKHDYSDYTVFSFWLAYKIGYLGSQKVDTEILALSWLDCVAAKFGPEEIESEFLTFYAHCYRTKYPPSIVLMEKASTGVTLCAVVEKIQGINILPIERTKASGNKATRFMEMIPFVNKRLITFPQHAPHYDMCVNHMAKITLNKTHAHDDICFVQGTKIATIFGYKNIETIKIGDKVITPFGVGRVMAAGLTNKKVNVIKYKNIIGTPSHPVFNDLMFNRLDTLRDNAKIDILSLGGLIKWRYKKLLILMELNINLWGREDIILASIKQMLEESVLKDFMLQFGNFIAEKKFVKGMLFIIRMVIILITTIAIWSVFRANNICYSMLKNVRKFRLLKNKLNIWLKLGNKLKYGIKVLKGENGIEKMQKQASINQENLNALSVQRNLRQDQQMQNIAQEIVSESMMPFKLELEEPQNVYNLTIEKYGVYYANNILVSNCDTAYDAVKWALIDKLCLSFAHLKITQQNSAATKLAQHYKNINKIVGAQQWKI